MGANLQYYNPLIDDEVKKTWDIPSDRELTAQWCLAQLKRLVFWNRDNKSWLLVFGASAKI